MTDPLEQLREMRKKHFPSYSQTYSETLEHCACGVWRYKECDAIKLLDALEAVLAKEEKDASKTGWTYDERMGYNQCLSEVHSLIASALGGGGE